VHHEQRHRGTGITLITLHVLAMPRYLQCDTASQGVVPSLNWANFKWPLLASTHCQYCPVPPTAVPVSCPELSTHHGTPHWCAMIWTCYMCMSTWPAWNQPL